MQEAIGFGTWVKRRRRALDLTQESLAQRVGCSVSAIVKIEADERRPSRQIAELLAHHLEVPAEQRPLFLKVARGERVVEALDAVPVAAEPSLAPATVPFKVSLPPLSAPLVGREHELSTVVQLVQKPECRLLTLTGTGGVGKTRLAAEVAAQLQAAFAHESFFVSLAPVMSREQMITTIADALGVVLYSASDRGVQLLHHLRDKALLLTLDNFEHLLTTPESAEYVGKLLRAAPNLKIVVTSREPLNLAEEWVFEVQTLPVPPADGDEALERYSAVMLFVQRARADVNFRLTDGDRRAVARVCRLVEGLPLAIELAAAWVRVLSCAQIADEIERAITADPQLTFLSTRSRDVPERHRSLTAVFDHSWRLLTTDEQRAMRHLAVFRGGFGREAAEAVAGAGLPLLSALVAKSLLRRAAANRYDLHELVRQYALAHLRADEQEHTQALSRHSAYYAELLERHGRRLKGPERPDVVAELIAEIDNLRLAWNWAATHQRGEEVSRAADTLFWLYESRSNCREGVPLFGEAAQGLEAATDSTGRLALAQVLSYQGYFCFRQGQLQQARALLQRALSLLGALSLPHASAARAALSDATAFLGTVTYMMGDYFEGRRLLRESLHMKRDLGDRWGAALCLRELGLSAYYLGEYTEAHDLLGQSLALSREMGNLWANAVSLNYLSAAAYAQGNIHEARQWLQEALALSQAMEDRHNIAFALNGLGRVSHALGDDGEARRLFEDSIAISREIGDQTSMAHALCNLGHTLLALADLPGARRCFLETIAVAGAAQMVPVLLDGLLGMAALRAAENAEPAALALALHVLSHPATNREARDQAARLCTLLEARLSPPQVAEALSHAQASTLDTALTDALGGAVADGSTALSA